MFAWLAVDITEKKRLEEQFLHAQKLEAMGRLASGVAHDFANLLTVIRASADFLSSRGPRDDDDLADLDEIRAAVDRADSLTRQLLSYARRRHEHASRVDACAAVTAIAEMLQRLAGSRNELVLELGPEEAPIFIDLQQLEQALANLVVNARDAMPDGGFIRICVDVRREPGLRRPRVVIAVKDTGIGIPAGIRERIFDAFFTTKPEGMGTGLGLSAVMGIVTHAGGKVAVESEVGTGTTFTMSFPWDGDGGAEDEDDGEGEGMVLARISPTGGIPRVLES